ncbi:unnamed protein product [Gemmata massiliana]|uniref:Uncharacterized protein n=1 Tax=Gemmata massiliana TaxID=1210884 RepID=A0A6P2CUK7_9BACT|nr:hypothetical protein [Gemmata massiliana]VTR92659.1 unnamed protein product [Gemmata massiliana]
MPKSTNWVWATVIGAGSVLAAPPSSKGHDEPLPATAPAPKEAPPNEAWFPKKIEYQKGKDPVIDSTVPSVFPNLVFARPTWDGKDEHYDAFQKDLEALCDRLWPRMRGNIALKIGTTDNELQRLLKAQLNQELLGYRNFIVFEKMDWSGPRLSPVPFFVCLKNIQTTVLELWTKHPQELVPWLKELVTVAKERERYIRVRVEASVFPPQYFHYAVRHRFKTETELWKATSINAQRDETRPAPKDAPRAKPAGSEWLADKKRPPSLFPDIVLPPPEKNDPDWKIRRAQFAKRCPRLNGNTGLKIEDGDSTAQKLLKARLHQGALETHQLWGQFWEGEFRTLDTRPDCLNDMLTVLDELWGKEPKRLIPWLKELLVEAKEFERYAELRAEARAIRPSELNQATRHRLKIEGELWKAKNAK